ncbi:MAG: glycosyltransferase [Paludibacteraceae bacterium]|nr:glycosyltransferase [Paludibacteraceae bacterium]
MKTILHISKYYSPFIGGIETVAKQLVSSLDGYQNVVICFSNDRQTHYDTVDGVQVIRVGVCASISSQDIAPAYYKHLKNIIKSIQPDLVHIHCPNPYIYPILLWLLPKRTKLVVHWHSDILGKGMLYHLIAPFERLLLKRADLILTTSPNYAPYSHALLPFKHKISILPNVITPDRFTLQPTDDAAIQHIREQWQGKTLLLFCGRHVAYKGVEHLIEAEQWMQPNIQILIAGTGPLTSEYQDLAKDCKRITFLGKLSNDELRCYLHAADLFAFPSINKAEAFGVVLAEAMYCRCVPIVFHIEGSGVNWVNINKETGLEVPIGYAQEYAKAVNLLSTDDNLRQQMATAAHRRISDLFTISSFNQQINYIYNRLFSK